MKPWWDSITNDVGCTQIAHARLRRLICRLVGHDYLNVRKFTITRRGDGYEGCACARCAHYHWFATP